MATALSDIELDVSSRPGARLESSADREVLVVGAGLGGLSAAAARPAEQPQRVGLLGGLLRLQREFDRTRGVLHRRRRVAALQRDMGAHIGQGGAQLARRCTRGFPNFRCAAVSGSA